MDLLAVAEEAARTAGAELLRRWRLPVSGLATKTSATDPVSDADRAAEAAVLATIRRARPDDAILSEEAGAASGTSGIRWLVDPLDGTVNYLYGIPQWSVSIAALDAEGALAAVVYDVVRDECFTAARGAGAHLDGVPIAPTALRDLSGALLATGYSYVAAERDAQARAESALVGRVRDIRRLGSAALDLAWVAAARIDGYFETVVSPWDWAAGALLVSEAGGRVSEVPGPRREVSGIVASGAGIHTALVDLVRVHRV